MRSLLIFCIILILTIPAAADSGLISLKSPHDVQTTADRLEAMLKAQGMTLFNRIDHAAAAAAIGAELRPTQLLIFGNPKVGTPLMQCHQAAAIDLPQKALIWQDESGQTWLGYNDPHFLATRHAIHDCEAVLDKIATALDNFARATTAP
jgi:uncharacterized protein (DUF302 family)